MDDTYEECLLLVTGETVSLNCRFVKQIGRRIRKEKASQAVS